MCGSMPVASLGVESKTDGVVFFNFKSECFFFLSSVFSLGLFKFCTIDSESLGSLEKFCISPKFSAYG